MIDLWWAEAGEHKVLPLDDTLPQRLLVPKPRVLEERDSYVYYSPVRLREITHEIICEIFEAIAGSAQLKALAGAPGLAIQSQ